ncbi:DUF2946 domain-containing protein [Oxalobacteraceae bacterium]|nr:DUF2946 domain-containing protein [Oxalobacteraceae bacterium]
MTRPSTIWRLQVWIALFAILMNALAPSISHAVNFAQGQPPGWEICRSDSGSRADTSLPDFSRFSAVNDAGKKLLVLAPADARQSDKKAMNMDDCGYCAPHAGSVGLMPPPVAGLGVFGPQASHPFLFYRSPSPLAAWSAARPRGPPAA